MFYQEDNFLTALICIIKDANRILRDERSPTMTIEEKVDLLNIIADDISLNLKFEVGYLGEERTPVKEWLAACLWYSITYNPILFIEPDYKVALGRAQKGLVDQADAAGISVREWADSALGKRPDYR